MAPTSSVPLCGAWADQVDHVVRKADGGTDDVDNLRAACRSCNLRRSGGRGSAPGWRGGSTRRWRRVRLFVLSRDGYRCQVPVDEAAPAPAPRAARWSW